ncbi:hypothetical protein ACWDUN_25875 [Mycobacterium sp. NPDC003323]
MSGICRECRDSGADAELEHCHGTVIVHIGQRPECTEPDCRTPEAAHTYTIDCFAVGCECAEQWGAQPMGPASASVV